MAYTLAGLRTSVRSKIKDSSYSASLVDEFINDAIIEIADLYTWKQFEKVVDGSLTVSEYTFSQQSDHQTTTRLVLINPDDSTKYWDLTKHMKTHKEFFSLYPVPDAQDASQPWAWTEYGTQIYFNCPVDDDYTLRQFYQKIPTELTADADVPELPRNFREAIVLGAAYRAEEERDNYDIAGVLQNRFNDRVGDLMMRFANSTMVGPDSGVLKGRIK